MAEEVLISVPVRNYNAAQFKNQLTVLTFTIPANDAGYVAVRATITNFDATDSLQLWFERSTDGGVNWSFAAGDGNPINGVASGIYPSDETPAEWSMSFGAIAVAALGRLNCLMTGSLRAAVTLVRNNLPV